MDQTPKGPTIFPSSFTKKKLGKGRQKWRKPRAKANPLALGASKKITANDLDFYQTQMWKEIRFKAFRRDVGRCALCGRSRKDQGVMVYAVHIKPIRKYPTLALALDNVQLLCADCKGGRPKDDETDFRVG